MAGLARMALILTLTRLANYGLMIISPVILVRFLSVADFGRYREFLLYATLVQACASFSVFDSMLYFIPAHGDSKWRVVRQSIVLTAQISFVAIGLLVLLNAIMGGGIVGAFLIPVIAYVMLFINVDFWEAYWLSQSRMTPVFLYSAGRLIARMLVVVVVGVITANVTIIIWSLIAMEGARFIGSVVMWRIRDRSKLEPVVPQLRRDQLHYCLPAGLAVVIAYGSGNLGNVAVDKVLGAAALAQLTIGTFGAPVVMAVRNSISTSLLPSMVRSKATATANALLVWQRAVAVNCILMFPICVLSILYAEPLIVRVFGEHFRPAIVLMQIYSLTFIRACFDFSPALRAINKTRPLVSSNVLAFVATGICLYFLLPIIGSIGAIVAMVVGTVVEAVYLGWSTVRLYQVSTRDMLPWREVSKIGAAALLVGAVAYVATWSRISGLPGVIFASAAYSIAFAALMMVFRVKEADVFVTRIKDVLSRAKTKGRS